MAFIKVLKEFITRKDIFPITKTNAVYDDRLGRLDSYLNLTISSEEVDDIESEDVELIDADTLGGRYTVEDLDSMPKGEVVEDYAEVIPPPDIDADLLGGKYTANDITRNFNNINTNFNNINTNLSQFIAKNNYIIKSDTEFSDVTNISKISADDIKNMPHLVHQSSTGTRITGMPSDIIGGFVGIRFVHYFDSNNIVIELQALSPPFTSYFRKYNGTSWGDWVSK